jgi:DNA polymerase-3 subunit gamma/tau
MRTALGIGASETVMQITDALGGRDVAEGLGVINAAVDKGMDPRQFARQMVEHLRALLLLKLGSRDVLPHISDDMLPSLQDQAAVFSRRQLVRAVQLFNEAAREAKGGWQPQLPLEIAFIEAVLAPESTANNGGDSPSAKDSRPSSSRHRAPRPAPPKGSSASSTESRQSRSRAEKTEEPNRSEQASDPEVVRESAAVYEVRDGEDGPLTTELILEQWPRFLNALRPRDLSLEALMRSCEPVGVENDVVVLSFSHKFHRSKVEEDKKRGIVEDVLSDLLGRKLRIRCVIDKHRESYPGQAVAEEIGEEGEPKSQDVSDDPVVQMAVNELGAEVVGR